MRKMMFLMPVFCLGVTASMNAQVTIGENTAPHSGAVLDLKSTTQGLRLPNVALKVDPTDFVLEGEVDKATATGMVIYNTANVRQGPGIYAWDGEKWVLISSNSCTSVTDIDGNTYPAKMFGTQCWMTKNLRVSRSYTGAILDGVKLNPGYFSNIYGGATMVKWIAGKVEYTGGSDNAADSAFYRENGITYKLDYNAFANKFGFLYTFALAREVCPEGWHLPSAAEWNTLAVTLGNVRNVSSPGTEEFPSWTENIAGQAIKANNFGYAERDTATITRNWGGFAPGDPKNSGFNALPAGLVHNNAVVYRFGANAYLWTSDVTVGSADGRDGWGWYRNVFYQDKAIYSSNDTGTASYSVRCLRN